VLGDGSLENRVSVYTFFFFFETRASRRYRGRSLPWKWSTKCSRWTP
jgi:hypothetical protein